MAFHSYLPGLRAENAISTDKNGVGKNGPLCEFQNVLFISFCFFLNHMIRFLAFKLGMHRSDTLDRYRLQFGHLRRDDPNPMLCLYYCAVVKPHESHKNIIKHHKVFVHYISSVLKLFHSLIWGTDEYLNNMNNTDELYISYAEYWICIGLIRPIPRSSRKGQYRSDTDPEYQIGAPLVCTSVTYWSLVLGVSTALSWQKALINEQLVWITHTDFWMLSTIKGTITSFTKRC